MKQQRDTYSGGKIALAIVLAIAVLIASQLLAQVAGTLLVGVGLPAAVGNIVLGALYVALAYGGLRLLCQRVLHTSTKTLRLSPQGLQWRWLVVALLMPLVVIRLAMVVGGSWVLSDVDVAQTLTAAIFYYGMAAGIVEELVFRGVIMGVLAACFGRAVAILAPSLLFGVVHVIGSGLGVIDGLQVVVAGSLVGILFSLIALATGSVWNSAIVHGVWNVAFASGLIAIAPAPEKDTLLTYVISTHSQLITGGDFGIEASILAILVYTLASAFALWSGRRAR
ncbi:MAG: type II CAAX endopeptidase family protein [Peptococcaceae bacterium]|nr:type II CAAX endopeptidase family protein [Peptococcaceae bacterium]